jgi:hypothetical protein
MIISCPDLVTMRNIPNKFVEKIKTHFILYDDFTQIVLFMGMCGKIWQNYTAHRRQYDACALHAVYLRLQIVSQNI